MGLFGIGSSDPRSGKRKSTSILVNADFAGIATADVTPVAAQYVFLGAYTVPFGCYAAVGVNDTNGATNVAGTPSYILLSDSSGNTLTGSIQVRVCDPLRRNNVFILEERSERWAASATDRTTSLLIPERLPLVQPQSRIELWVKMDAATVIDYNGTTTAIRLPVTYYY